MTIQNQALRPISIFGLCFAFILAGCSQQAAQRPESKNQPEANSATSGQPDSNSAANDSKAKPGEKMATKKAPPNPASLMRRANSFVRSGNLKEAIALVKQARELDAENPQYGMGLVQLLQMHASRIVQNDRESANEYFFEAAKVARDLLKNDEVPGQMKSFLASAIYNEACCFSIDGQADNALASLTEAFEQGFEDFELVNSDADLDTLRNSNSAEFEALINEYHGAFVKRLVAETQLELAEFDTFDFDFQLPDINGNTVSKTDFQGKVLIADIWGTWCPPCREEIPSFIELKEKYAGQMDIVGINYERVEEEEEAIAKIKDFIEEYQMNYNCVIGDEETKQQVPNFRGYPTTLFIDQKGQVRLTLVGLHSMAKLESVIQLLIDETGAE